MDSSELKAQENRIVNLSLNVALRLTLAALLLVWCFSILRPFLVPLTWAIILAVALNGVYAKIVGVLGGKRGLGAAAFALLGIALVVVPSYTVGGSLVGTVRGLESQIESGTLNVPPPPESIRNIPAVGEDVYNAWVLADTNIQQAAVQLQPQLQAFGSWFLGFLAGVGGTVVTTVFSLIIAAFLLTYSEGAVAWLRRVVGMIQGAWQEDLVGMAGKTINSVARGVLGVAVIQAGLAGVGLFAAGVPAAGLFTVLTLVLAIIQLPPTLILILPIIWAWGNLGTVWALAFTIYMLLVGVADTPLKAVFLSKGNVVPMPVVLLGAIGGMVSMGMMGLFLGAIVLSLGYKIMEVWLYSGDIPEEAYDSTGSSGEEPAPA
jgi:predicted PurR-regulated permease PerM